MEQLLIQYKQFITQYHAAKAKQDALIVELNCTPVLLKTDWARNLIDELNVEIERLLDEIHLIHQEIADTEHIYTIDVIVPSEEMYHYH